MRMTILLCSMLAMTLAAGSALAQPMATVEGVVTDASGGVLPGARIEARSGGQSVATAMTGNDGRYRLELPVATTYELSARLDGFAALSTRGEAIGCHDSRL